MSAASHGELVELLKDQRLFSEFEGEDWATFFAILTERTVSAGEAIVRQGDEGGTAFVVVKGQCLLYRANHLIRRYGAGDCFGELSLFAERRRLETIVADTPVTLLCMRAADLNDASQIPSALAKKLYKGIAHNASGYLGANSSLYQNMEVLIVQDGGCAPGYNPVTAFLSEYLEKAGHRVFVAASGFRSLVTDRAEDYRCLVYGKETFAQLDHIPGVLFSPPLRDLRGANFRSERYPQFRSEALQQQAAKHIKQRNVKVLIGVGGNGTCAGTHALSRFLDDDVQVFFIPVTIDSDVSGTECIGEYTGVEYGAEKLRCYMADARTHRRLYIIEMMGASGGYHALHSCLGAGAHLAVLPNHEYDLPALVEALQDRQGTVIVVAEGYKAAQRKAQGHGGNAAEFFRDELLANGLQTQQKIVCEPFSRDIRGASPNNMDIALAQRMAGKLVELVQAGQSGQMPAVQSGRAFSIAFDDIDTDNSVAAELAALANRLT